MAQNSASPTPEANSLEGFQDLTALTAYSMRGGPRGGPGKDATEGFAHPGLRRGTLARTSVSSDSAGAALDIVGSVNRAATLRDYLQGQPKPYDPAQDRKGMRVMPNRAGANGQSSLWQSRARNTARGR
jgi:hypothetical protein